MPAKQALSSKKYIEREVVIFEITDEVILAENLKLGFFLETFTRSFFLLTEL